jgi:hypothetical protein
MLKSSSRTKGREWLVRAIQADQGRHLIGLKFTVHLVIVEQITEQMRGKHVE